MAASVGAGLRSLIEGPSSPHEVFAALRNELVGPPSILVIEDAHWADEATLDVLRLLGRRVASLPVLTLVTYRDEQLGAADPLRIVLGDLARVDGVARLAIQPLSPAAVGRLAEGTSVDPEQLHLRTAGNPFYVTEVLRADQPLLPSTVRDAVLGRMARLGSEAHVVLEVVAAPPSAADVRLLEAVCGDCAGGVAACLAAGMLVDAAAGIGFRHEIAREAVEHAMPAARRRQVHRQILAALTATGGRTDPARLAHHAELAGDAAAVRRFAQAAAARASSLGAHREAAAQYGRALRFSDDLPASTRADLLEARSAALFAADEQVDSIADLHAAISLHEQTGEIGRQAGAMHRLAPRLVCRGLIGEARAAAVGAVALLEHVSVCRETGGAAAARAYMHLVDGDLDGAIEWGWRATAIAEELDDAETRIAAAVTAATAELLRDGPARAHALEQALEQAQTSGQGAQVPRALNNLALTAVVNRDHLAADRWIGEALSYADGRELDLWRLSILSIRARSELDQGRFTDASATADAVVSNRFDSPGPRIDGLLVLALVRARRGDPGAARAFADATAAAEGDPTWQVGLASVGAEIAWLTGRSERIGEATAVAYERALQGGSPWPLAELASWRHRAGFEIVSDRTLPDPVALELLGRHTAAAAAWQLLGCPYEAALALSLADDPGAIADAHARLLDLGAGAAAGIAARSLRERGVRGIVRGPRRATRRNPANLTRRELDVLALLADGLSNSEIANRLFVSTRTVDHHVSAILRKLDVSTRGRAIKAAAAIGIVPAGA